MNRGDGYLKILQSKVKVTSLGSKISPKSVKKGVFTYMNMEGVVQMSQNMVIFHFWPLAQKKFGKIFFGNLPKCSRCSEKLFSWFRAIPAMLESCQNWPGSL